MPGRIPTSRARGRCSASFGGFCARLVSNQSAQIDRNKITLYTAVPPKRHPILFRVYRFDQNRAERKTRSGSWLAFVPSLLYRGNNSILTEARLLRGTSSVGTGAPRVIFTRTNGRELRREIRSAV